MTTVFDKCTKGSFCLFFKEFYCLGGWEEDVPLASLLSSQLDDQPSYKTKASLQQRRNYNSFVVSDDEQPILGDLVSHEATFSIHEK